VESAESAESAESVEPAESAESVESVEPMTDSLTEVVICPNCDDKGPDVYDPSYYNMESCICIYCPECSTGAMGVLPGYDPVYPTRAGGPPCTCNHLVG
jgi:hypothetical protein